jgi:hypothetical protein
LFLGDFPNVDLYRKMLAEIKDISDFKKLDKNMVFEMDKVLTHDIPMLLQKATSSSTKDPSRNYQNSDVQSNIQPQFQQQFQKQQSQPYPNSQYDVQYQQQYPYYPNQNEIINNNQQYPQKNRNTRQDNVNYY